MLRPVLRSTLVVLSVFALTGSAKAAPFAPDITIIGTSFYDTSFAEEIGVSNVEGSIFDTVMGLTSTSEFNGNIIVGANPRLGGLTDIDDEIGLAAVGLAATQAIFKASGALGLSLTNNSATDSYEVAIDVAYANRVYSEGQAAWITSGFSASDSRGGSITSEVLSSTLVPNFVNGVMVPGPGGFLADGGLAPLSYLLNPGDSVDLVGLWGFAGAVDSEESLVTLDFFGASFKVTDVSLSDRSEQPVPEPTAALCFGLGLLAMSRFTRRS